MEYKSWLKGAKSMIAEQLEITDERDLLQYDRDCDNLDDKEAVKALLQQFHAAVSTCAEQLRALYRHHAAIFATYGVNLDVQLNTESEVHYGLSFGVKKALPCVLVECIGDVARV